MAYRTCPDCGSRIFEYGCVNCNEMEYISMQDNGEMDLFFKTFYKPKVPVTLEEKFEDCRRRLFENIERRCYTACDMLDLKYVWGVENENKAGAILLTLRQKGLYKYFRPEHEIEFYDKYGQPIK